MSPFFIGSTVIAFGTSAPEMLTTFFVSLEDQGVMVVGNVIGSNIMNIALVVPIIGMFSDATFESNILSRDFLVLSITSILFILILLLILTNDIAK